MAIDRQTFFNSVRMLFGGQLKQSQVGGMSAILDEWDRRDPNGDPRWLAYMLATSFHETAREMLPVREAYWLSEDWRRKNLTRYYPYYGRGYVQLTWAANYAKAGSYVRADLVQQPDLALRPDYAAAIMFVGMREGWFRGDAQGRRHTLARYFGHNVNDPVGAREIINGREVKNGVLLADTIARYHAVFLGALAQRAGAAATADASMMMVASSGADFSPALDAFPTLTDSSGRADDAVSSRGEPEFDMQGFLTPGDAAMSRTRMLELTAQIVTGYVSKNTISHMELHDVISRVHAALEDTGAPGDLGETDGGEGSDGVDLEGQNPEENAALAAQAGPPQIARTRRPRAGDGATA